MDKIISFVLKICTIIYIKKNNIEVIAITGSAGKTTTKTVLSKLIEDKNIYVPSEGYNTEIGIPLAIFKEKVPSNLKNIFGWLKIIFFVKIKIFKKPVYKKIILELGADKPGDISYFMSFIKPKISVITSVLPVHLEYFKNIDNVEKEKGLLAENTAKNGFVILNNDDIRVKNMASRTNAKVITYGLTEGSDLKYSKVKVDENGHLSFDLYWKGGNYPIKTNFIAPQLIPSILSAIATAICLGNNIDEIIAKFTDIFPEKGRMNLLKGINNSLLIDDSYNANPASTIAALEVLKGFRGRKIAVIGSMNELGKFEEEGHIMVAEKAVQVADILVFVGDKTKQYSFDIAVKKMNKNCVQYFNNPYKAAEFLKGIVSDGDVMLFKGSQNGVFLEEAIKKVISEPETAQSVLVRQSKMWQDKKERFYKDHREDGL